MSSKTPDPMAVEEVALCAAMRRRVTELKDSAASLADPRPWIKDRPLTTCLIAAGAGLALGMFAGARKTAPTSHAAADGNVNGNGNGHGNGHAAAHQKERQTLGALLAASLVPTLQPMISDLIHSAIGGGWSGGSDNDKTADVSAESIPSGLADDNKVID